MCGLVALISKHRNGFTGANLEMFDSLLYMDALRGQDSTGVMMVDNSGNVQIAKSAQCGADYIKEKAYKELRMKAIQRGWALVGHNRKATKGAIKDVNAHPFWVEDKIVLVHNGGVFGDHKLLKDTEVDSEAIAHTLANEENVEKALQKVNAAYALIWYEVQKKRLNFIRNQQRPLAWAETDDMYIFASEAPMIEFVAERHSVKLVSTEGMAWDVTPGELDMWDLQKDKSSVYSTKKINYDYVHTPVVQPVAQRMHVVPHPGFQSRWGESSNPLSDDEGGDDTAIGLEAANEAIASAMRGREASARAATAAKNAGITAPVAAAPTWANRHSFLEFNNFKAAYEGKKVRVDVTAYLPDVESNVPGAIMVTGKTIDNNNLYAVFPVHKETFDNITDPSFKGEKVIFIVDVTKVAWRPDTKQEGIDLMQKKGAITLVGDKGRILQAGPHPVQ